MGLIQLRSLWAGRRLLAFHHRCRGYGYPHAPDGDGPPRRKARCDRRSSRCLSHAPAFNWVRRGFVSGAGVHRQRRRRTPSFAICFRVISGRPVGTRCRPPQDFQHYHDSVGVSDHPRADDRRRYRPLRGQHLAQFTQLQTSRGRAMRFARCPNGCDRGLRREGFLGR